MILIGAITAEIIKIRRSGLLWLASLGTIIVNMIFAMLAIYYPNIFLDNSQYQNVWYTWIAFHYQGILGLLLPMYLVIICALSINLENRNDTWRFLYVLPVPKYIIYLSKLFIVTCIFILSHFLFLVLLILSPLIIQIFRNELNFIFLEIPFELLVSFFVRTILSSFGIIGLVFFISYFSRSFIFPLAFGIIGFVIANLLLDQFKFPEWFPFTYPALNLFSKDSLTIEHKLWLINLYSILYYILFLGIGIYFSKKDTIKTR